MLLSAYPWSTYTDYRTAVIGCRDDDTLAYFKSRLARLEDDHHPPDSLIAVSTYEGLHWSIFFYAFFFPIGITPARLRDYRESDRHDIETVKRLGLEAFCRAQTLGLEFMAGRDARPGEGPDTWRKRKNTFPPVQAFWQDVHAVAGGARRLAAALRARDPDVEKVALRFRYATPINRDTFDAWVPRYRAGRARYDAFQRRIALLRRLGKPGCRLHAWLSERAPPEPPYLEGLATGIYLDDAGWESCAEATDAIADACDRVAAAGATRVILTITLARYILNNDDEFVPVEL